MKITQSIGFTPFFMGKIKYCTRYNVDGKLAATVFRLNFKKSTQSYPVFGADEYICQATQGWKYDIIKVHH